MTWTEFLLHSTLAALFWSDLVRDSRRSREPVMREHSLLRSLEHLLTALLIVRCLAVPAHTIFVVLEAWDTWVA